jgi:voltage-gated sodium channel
MAKDTISGNWRLKLHNLLETRLVQRAIIAVILINAVILGLETAPAVVGEYGELLYQLDRICLGIFVVELSLAIVAMGPGTVFPRPLAGVRFYRGRHSPGADNRGLFHPA